MTAQGTRVTELDIARAARIHDDAAARSGIHWDSHQRRRTRDIEPACLACAQLDRAEIDACRVWESLVMAFERQRQTAGVR